MKFLQSIAEVIRSLFSVGDSQPAVEGVMTLEISGTKRIANPTEADIRDAVYALDTSGDAFLILGASQLNYMQCSGDRRVGFDLEYQQDSVDNHFRAVREDWDADTIVTKLTQYAIGDEAWREGVEWKLIDW